MRSADAVGFLVQQGFSNVKNLIGGIESWSIEIDNAVPRY
jgi:adenylyltransferase/sulfurtransferase